MTRSRSADRGHVDAVATWLARLPVCTLPSSRVGRKDEVNAAAGRATDAGVP